MIHNSVPPSYASYHVHATTAAYLPSRYVSSRPIRINTADLDVFRARPVRVPLTSPQGAIHRERSVVRLKSSRSPGARLVEKFRIKDPVTSSAPVPLAGESSSRSVAINEVSVCQVRDVPVSIVHSKQNYEVSEKTVTLPLRKTCENYQEVTVSLRPRQYKAISSFESVSENVTINKSAHLQTSSSKYNTSLTINFEHQNHANFIEHTKTIIKESGPRKTDIECLPKCPPALQELEANCNNRVSFKEVKESSNLPEAEYNNRNYISDSAQPDIVPIIQEQSNYLLDPSNVKVRKKNTSEKVEPKQGKKLKIGKVNVELSDAKIVTKGEEVINTSFTLTADNNFGKHNTLRVNSKNSDLEFNQKDRSQELARDETCRVPLNQVPDDNKLKHFEQQVEVTKQVPIQLIGNKTNNEQLIVSKYEDPISSQCSSLTEAKTSSISPATSLNTDAAKSYCDSDVKKQIVPSNLHPKHEIKNNDYDLGKFKGVPLLDINRNKKVLQKLIESDAIVKDNECKGVLNEPVNKKNEATRKISKKSENRKTPIFPVSCVNSNETNSETPSKKCVDSNKGVLSVSLNNNSYPESASLRTVASSEEVNSSTLTVCEFVSNEKTDLNDNSFNENPHLNEKSNVKQGFHDKYEINQKNSDEKLIEDSRKLNSTQIKENPNKFVKEKLTSDKESEQLLLAHDRLVGINKTENGLCSKKEGLVLNKLELKENINNGEKVKKLNSNHCDKVLGRTDTNLSVSDKKSECVLEGSPKFVKTKKRNKSEGGKSKSIDGRVPKKKVSNCKKGKTSKVTTSVKTENKGKHKYEEDFEDEGLGKDFCSVKTTEGSINFDSDWEEIEIEEMEGGVPKKKLIVRKKGTKVTVTPLELKPPAVVKDVAKTGQITRKLSQKRLSLVDEDLGFLDDRKMSITDEIIVEEAAVLDDMIHKELAATGRRKSSLGLPALEVAKIDVATKATPTLQDKRREIWKNKMRTSGKSLGKFYKPLVEEKSTSSSSEDEECDVNCHRKCQRLMPNLCGVNHKLVAEALSKLKKSRRSGRSSTSTTSSSIDQDGSVSTSFSSISIRNSSDSDSNAESASGRLTPPAKTLPKFRTYSIKDFQFLKVLGKGSFGKVLLAELKGSECYYAVKCLKKDVVLEDDDVECTMIERKVLALGTGHPYFCHLFCTFQTQSHLFFVMEYLNGGDLMFHIQQSGRFDEGRARFYAAEIISGLTFLHKWGIVYRDLKLDNVLLDFDGHVRIADFGMCKLQIYLDKTTDTFCGTPDYMAPEIIKGLKYNQCVDWWSFGILLYEMLVGQSPFSGCDEDDLFWSICNMRPHFPRHLSAEAKSILNGFLEKDWTKRLGSSENGASDVMNHEFFNGLKWHLLERRQLEPPFKPHMKHPLDTKYFDRAFTSEKPVLTPVDKSILESMDQTQFQGFSYTNPNATE